MALPLGLRFHPHTAEHRVARELEAIVGQAPQWAVDVVVWHRRAVEQPKAAAVSGIPDRLRASISAQTGFLLAVDRMEPRIEQLAGGCGVVARRGVEVVGPAPDTGQTPAQSAGGALGAEYRSDFVVVRRAVQLCGGPCEWRAAAAIGHIVGNHVDHAAN